MRQSHSSFVRSCQQSFSSLTTLGACCALTAMMTACGGSGTKGTSNIGVQSPSFGQRSTPSPKATPSPAAEKMNTEAPSNKPSEAPEEKPQTYHVGGRVFGLSEGQITLSLNGSEDLDIDSESTSFTFERALESNDRYSVEITDIEDEIRCEVFDGDDRIGSRDVDTVQISCVSREVVKAVNVGGNRYTSRGEAKIQFEADSNQYYTNGNEGGFNHAINNTDDDPLFQTERWGEFAYTFDIDNGIYDVELYFAETYFGTEGPNDNRVFDIKIEGQTAISDFDPKAAGTDTANIERINSIEVSDGSLNMEFIPTKNEANLNAIAVYGFPKIEKIDVDMEPDPQESAQPMTKSIEDCANPNHFLCIDFEDFTAADLPEGYTLGENTEIVSGQGVSGESSMKFYSDNKGAKYYGGYLRKYDVTGKHWGRVFVKIEGLNGGFMHTSFVAAQKQNDYEVRFVDTVKGNGIQLLYNFADDAGGRSSGYDYGYFENGAWQCAEWRIDHEAQEFEFFLNSNRINEISGNVADRPVPETFEWIAFGAQVYQNGPYASGWIDDIVLSSERVGCDPL